MKGELISENAYALILSITKGWEPEVCLRKCGVEIPFRPETAIKDDQIETVKAYYYDLNMSLTDIAKLYDCTRYSVKSFLDRAGIPVKPKGRYIR